MTFHKTFLPLAALAAGTAAAPAFAGGYAEPIAEPVPVVQTVEPTLSFGRFAGGYVGAFAGYADMGSDSGIPGDPSADGAIGGINAGYNWQSGAWVYGVEGDIAFTDLKDTGANGISTDVKNMATLRGKVGYDMGNWMPYATVGYTVADIDYSAGAASGSDDANGYTVGLGAEYALNDNWSVKGEYLYTKFEDSDFGAASFDHDANQVRIGANYRF